MLILNSVTHSCFERIKKALDSLIFYGLSEAVTSSKWVTLSVTPLRPDDKSPRIRGAYCM